MQDFSAVEAAIIDVPDFPVEGIIFKDITPILAQPELFQKVIEAFIEKVKEHKIEALVAVEARGFIFAPAIAHAVGLPLILARKFGKLPRKTVRENYDLEYGVDGLEIHEEDLQAGLRYAIIDDVLATGGTVKAVKGLVESLGGDCHLCLCLGEITALQGRAQFNDLIVETFLQF